VYVLTLVAPFCFHSIPRYVRGGCEYQRSRSRSRDTVSPCILEYCNKTELYKSAWSNTRALLDSLSGLNVASEQESFHYDYNYIIGSSAVCCANWGLHTASPSPRYAFGKTYSRRIMDTGLRSLASTPLVTDSRSQRQWDIRKEKREINSVEVNILLSL
jgi:hypothetical protein